MHRLLDVGGRVDHDGGAETGFVGEGTALEAPCDGLADAVAQRTAACGVQVEGTPEDGGKCCRDIACVEHYDHKCACNVEQRHQRHQLLGDSGHPLQSANDDEGCDHHQAQAGDESRHAEGGVHVAGNGIDLAHVADAEGCKDAEAGKQHRQRSADLPTALFRAQTIGEVVHGTARPLALFVFAAVVDAQHILGKAGHHAKQCHDPHPEDGTRAAGDDGRCHTYDVAGADGARQRRAHALELADGHVLLAGVRGDVLVGEDRTDGVPEPVAHFTELEKARAGAHPEAGAEQQRQTKGPPHHTVDGVVHLCDHLDHSLFSPYTQNKSGQNPPKALPAKFGALSFSAAGARRIPGCAPLRKDDGSVLLPERYSRLSLRPYTFGTRRSETRASPECTDTACRTRLFQFFRRTAVRDRKTIPYSVLVRKTFYISYAAFSSVMQTDEFYFGVTFQGRSMGGRSSQGSSAGLSGAVPRGPVPGSAPSKPRRFPSGLASPFSLAVS